LLRKCIDRNDTDSCSGENELEEKRLLDLSPAEWTAIFLSLRIGVVATLVSLPLGIFVAYALARWNFFGKTIVNGIVHLPLVMPPVVTGFLLLILFGRKGEFGAALAEIGIVFSFRWTGAALACGVMGFPLMVRAIRLSFEAVDRRLELAAGSLGANRVETFLLVSLPLAFPGIVVGAILAFAKALGEFGATITFVSNIPGETQTIAAAIYTYTQIPGGEASALRLTAVSIAISLLALVASEFLQRRAELRLAYVT
jgi:molybdate transport system permease protein